MAENEMTSYDTLFGRMALEQKLCTEEELKSCRKELKNLSSESRPDTLENLMVKKVLLVDDEKEFTNFLKSSLEERGYATIEANNAIEGGLYLATEKPDLIVMDIRMRGINGLDACRAIRRNPETAHIPIFIVSALVSDQDVAQGLKAGATRYFSKPLDLENFLKEITQTLT